jgi:hypothetical protein
MSWAWRLIVSELDGLVGRPNGICSERDGEFCAGDVVTYLRL